MASAEARQAVHVESYAPTVGGVALRVMALRARVPLALAVHAAGSLAIYRRGC